MNRLIRMFMPRIKSQGPFVHSRQMWRTIGSKFSTLFQLNVGMTIRIVKSKITVNRIDGTIWWIWYLILMPWLGTGGVWYLYRHPIANWLSLLKKKKGQSDFPLFFFMILSNSKLWTITDQLSPTKLT